MSQKYDPETFVSQKHKNMLVRKIEINDKNTDFQRDRFYKLRADISSSKMAEEREERKEKRTQECAPQ